MSAKSGGGGGGTAEAPAARPAAAGGCRRMTGRATEAAAPFSCLRWPSRPTGSLCLRARRGTRGWPAPRVLLKQWWRQADRHGPRRPFSYRSRPGLVRFRPSQIYMWILSIRRNLREYMYIPNKPPTTRKHRHARLYHHQSAAPHHSRRRTYCDLQPLGAYRPARPAACAQPQRSTAERSSTSGVAALLSRSCVCSSARHGQQLA